MNVNDTGLELEEVTQPTPTPASAPRSRGPRKNPLENKVKKLEGTIKELEAIHAANIQGLHEEYEALLTSCRIQLRKKERTLTWMVDQLRSILNGVILFYERDKEDEA